MQHRVCAAIAGAFFIVLSACGGGGGGATPPAAGGPTPVSTPGTTPSPAKIFALPSSIALMDLRATQTLALAGGAQSPIYAVDATQCAGIANSTQTSTTTFNVSAVALGNCNLIASDGHGNSVSVYVSVTGTSVIVQ